MKLVTATQAQFFPPLYMFVRFAACNDVIFMQEAQYSVKGGHSRLLYEATDPPSYISIPVQGRGQKPIQDIMVERNGMWEFHNQIKNKYSHFPYFRNVYDYITTRTNYDPMNLHDFNVSIIKHLFGLFAINCTIHNSKDIVPIRPVNPTNWLSELAQGIGATDYIQGKAGIDAYFETNYFQHKKISVYAQNVLSDLPIHESVLTFLFKYGVTETMSMIHNLAQQKPLLIRNFK